MINLELILILILLKGLEPKCGEGCLRCNALIDLCEACDYVQGYYDDRKGGCDKITIDNCMHIDSGGKCKYCSSNFRPQTLSGDCGELTENQIIQDCLHYDADANCIQCNDGFYLKNASCRQVLVPISGCQSYQAETPEICLLCTEGKILNKDGTSCEDVDNDDNCLAYNYYNCNSCLNGYYFNSNSYISTLIADSDAMYQYMQDISSKKLHSKIGQFCLPETVNNCSKFLFNSICFVCEDGYFRNQNGECLLSPEEPLKNCMKYKGDGLCEECISGYF